MTVGLKSLPQAFVLTKNEGKKSFADWPIELASCGFGMSTDAFLKSVNNFLGKEVRIIPFLKKPLAFPILPQSFGILFTVGNVDRDIGRHSGRYSGRQSVDSRSIVGRQSVDSRSIVGRQSVDGRSIVGR